MAEVFLLPVAIKLAFFAGKCSEMDKRPKRSLFWSIADHFEAIKKFSLHCAFNEAFYVLILVAYSVKEVA